MDSGQEGWEAERLLISSLTRPIVPFQQQGRQMWNIFPIASGVLLHCLQPRLADSRFPVLVPHHNKSRSCSHPCPPRGTNLHRSFRAKERNWSRVLSHRKGSHVLKLPGFSFLVLLFVLDPCAQPDSWLWEREKPVLPAEKSNCFQFTQTTMLDSQAPCVGDFQLKFPISSHQRVQTTNSSRFHSVVLALCFTPILSSLAQCPLASIWGLFLEGT